MGEAVKKSAKKKAVTSAPAEVASPPKAEKMSDVVEVKNISDKNLRTSQGTIKPGDVGKATAAELCSWHKYMEKA